MTIEEMNVKLKGALNPKRYAHSVNVMNTAVQLAEKYSEDRDKAAIAGLLHDCARDIRGDEVFALCEKYKIEVDEITRIQPELLHGPIGEKIAKDEYGISNEDILTAIKYHTTGHENMSMLDKIIFLADYIEPNRNFPGIGEVRQAAFLDINSAMMLSLDRTLKYIVSKGVLIHPDTVKARNYIILRNLK
jgi:predicted HD superfamily hydrolase involved in NAD metabolism